MKEYTYEGSGGLRVLTLRLIGAGFIILSTSMAVVTLLIALWQIPLSDPGLSGVVCIALSILLIGWVGGFTSMNLYPTIRVGDKGLALSYFVFWWVVVPWDEVIDMKPIPLRHGDVLVRARHITPFHRFFGLRYWLSFLPSFVIGRDIRDRDELVREISKRIYVKDVR